VKRIFIMRACLCILVLLLFLPGLVRAGTIPAPRLVPGQYVYTIPANYDPPMIGRQGLRELQQQAKKLHYPFYIVVAESIPGEEDEDAAAAIDGLAEDWARNPRYNVGTSSIFLLSFSPRKFRVLAGSRWKDKLGLERDAPLPYTAIFENSVQGTPKDPKTGIINLMDEQKEAYERKLTQLADAREDATRRIRHYDGSPGRLPDLPATFINREPADFVSLLTSLNQFENAINAEVRHARNEYEAEERRRRASMESSFSSSSSHSSSSHSSSSSSHSSSSSSGGSYGGSGSSSAGGSW